MLITSFGLFFLRKCEQLNRDTVRGLFHDTRYLVNTCTSSQRGTVVINTHTPLSSLKDLHCTHFYSFIYLIELSLLFSLFLLKSFLNFYNANAHGMC